MKKTYILLSIFSILALIAPGSVAYANDNGVDELRGRWDFEWTFDGPGDPPPPLVLYINDLVENPYMPSMYFAGGCMRSPDSDIFMPLSLAAFPDPDNGTYEVTIYSTVVPEEWEPFVIRFTGTVEVHGKGVPDDVASGEITTEFATGQWNGTHHDRRRTKCPSVGYGQFVQADVRLQQDLAYNPPATAQVLELYTVVVSSAMKVDMPDGSTRIIEQYTDIFSPQVDFVGRFRYFEHFEGEHPVVGEPYTFTLLDMFGNPIPGTESTDIFWRCTQDAPRNITASDVFMDDVFLSWDPVPEIPGEFEPPIQAPESEFHLPYQVNINPVRGDASSEFGSLGQNTNHVIPWNYFEPGGPGSPDGFDFGQSLESFEDGLYQISLDSWNMPVVNQGGYYQDCAIYDSSETLFMQKSEGWLTFTSSSTISGVVTSEGGAPIADMWVDACEYDNDENPSCQSAITNEDGEYRVTRLLPGDYRVQTGGSGWTRAFYDNTPDWDLATRVATYPGADTESINFTLAQAGSISGTVYDDQGIPLANIAVDVEDGGYGTCTDENGNYTLEGLPLGIYNIAAGREFCEPHPYIEKVAFDVVIDVATPDVGGIDFYLEAGGSISGTVFDFESGSPLGGIAVDTEAGGYGTCTDENGFYSLDGLPAGSQVNVVAGRDFCGEHPYEEQILFDVLVGSTDVAFYLNEANNYFPSLHVVPAYPEIHGHEWNPEAIVTIYVDDDDDLDNGFIYTDSKLVTDEPTWCIEPCFDVSQVPELPYGILPGYVVTMMDDEATRVVHTTNLVWLGTDIDSDTVFGMAEPNTWIEVTAHGPQWGQRMVQADVDGNWVADFSVPGTEDFEQDILDLEPGFHGRSIQFEGGVPDDGTLAYWQIEEPEQPDIIAQPDHEWVASHGWAAEDLITMYIDDNADPSDGYLTMLTQTASPTRDVWFDSWPSPDLVPGMFVIVTNGSFTRVLEVESFLVASFDETADTVSGIAPPNREVGVGVHQPSGDFWLVVMSDSNGMWEADFGMEGIDMLNLEDIHAMIWDEDGDATQANYDFSLP